MSSYTNPTLLYRKEKEQLLEETALFLSMFNVNDAYTGINFC